MISREWDRFAKNEYERLAMEEENPEDVNIFLTQQSDMLEAMDPWDSDQDENSTADNTKAGDSS